MRFESTDLTGVQIVESMPVGDERGHFARTFCEREFAEAGASLAHRLTHSVLWWYRQPPRAARMLFPGGGVALRRLRYRGGSS